MRVVLAVALILVSSIYMRAQTGMRIKIVSHSEVPIVRHEMQAEENSTTIYVQGSRIRTELSMLRLPGRVSRGRIVTIQHCEERVLYTLSPDRHEFMETSMPSPSESGSPDKSENQKQADDPPNLVIEIATVDTGETKTAFGHAARHYVTTTGQTPSPELGQEPSETVEDIWYLDMPNVVTCERVSRRAHGYIGSGHTLPKIRPEFKYSGPEPQGLVLASTRSTKSTHTGERQESRFMFSHEIVAMEEVPIDSSQFEVPAGFKKVQQIDFVQADR